MKPLFFILAFTTSAFAQQQPLPEVQALQSRVMAEINSNLQCTTSVITLQQENAKLKAEIEELKKPKEPAK